MKFLYFLFIILASSTYRCADDVVDCNEASQNMVGEWSGITLQMVKHITFLCT